MYKIKVKSIIASSALVLTLLSPTAVSADNIDTQIELNNNKIEILNVKEKAAEEQLNKIKKEIKDTEEKAQRAIEESDAAKSLIAELKIEIEQLEKIIAAREEKLDEQARTIQSSELNTDVISMVIEGESLSNIVGKIDLVNKVISSNSTLIEQQFKDKESVDRKKTQSEANLKKIEDLSAELEMMKGKLIENKSKEEALIKQIEEDKNSTLRDISSLNSQKQAKLAREQEIARQQELARIAQEQRQASAISNSVTVSSGSVMADIQSAANSKAQGSVVNTSSSSVVSTASKYLGTPYIWGGRTPSGFDCSGFTSYVYKEVYGVNIGAWTGAQQYSGQRISVSEAQPGDLFFWGSGGSTSHVAIAINNGSYIHSPKPGDVVKVGSVSGWAPDFAVRVTK